MNQSVGMRTRHGRASVAVIVIVTVLSLLVVAVSCGGVVGYLQFRAVESRRQSADNLKKIGLALHDYRDTYLTFPPAYIPDQSGKPMHSWRVLILPFLGNEALHKRYRFDEPWDGPSNRLLTPLMPRVYCDPNISSLGSSETAYQALSDTNTILSGPNSVGFREISDGTSNTVIVVENTGALVPWLRPDDTSLDSLIQGIPFQRGEAGGTNALMADGAVRFLGEKSSQQQLHDLSTRSGGEVLEDF